MQGMRFLLVGEDGPINHGIIQSRITDEKWLCSYARRPAMSRIVNIEEMQQWNLFPTDEAMNEFILAIQAENNKPVADPKPTTAADKKKVKKKAKKKARKKTGLKGAANGA